MSTLKPHLYFIVSVILLLTSINLFSQTNPDLEFDTIFPRNGNIIEYVNIINVDSLSKKEIILNIKEWAINNFNSQKAALQSEDLETGYLLYQGLETNTYTIPKGWGFKLLGTQLYTITYETKFSIHFYVKDYKFKVAINNISNTAVSAYGVWNDVLTSSIATRKLDYPSVPIENAGQEAIDDYKKHPKDSKYLVRLNFHATRWREINASMNEILTSIKNVTTTKKKSAFDF